jgi:hypothetical protein
VKRCVCATGSLLQYLKTLEIPWTSTDWAATLSVSSPSLCGMLGFIKVDCVRYLEPHHVIVLANEGEDRLTM